MNKVEQKKTHKVYLTWHRAVYILYGDEAAGRSFWKKNVEIEGTGYIVGVIQRVLAADTMVALATTAFCSRRCCGVMSARNMYRSSGRGEIATGDSRWLGSAWWKALL